MELTSCKKQETRTESRRKKRAKSLPVKAATQARFRSYYANDYIVGRRLDNRHFRQVKTVIGSSRTIYSQRRTGANNCEVFSDRYASVWV